MGKTELEQAHRVVHFSCRRDRDLPATFPCFHKCCLCVPAHAHSPHGLAALTPPVCTPGSGTALPIQGNTSPASRHTLFSTVFAWLSSSNAFPCCCKIREKQGGKTRNFSQRELISLPKGKKKKKWIGVCLKRVSSRQFRKLLELQAMWPYFVPYSISVLAVQHVRLFFIYNCF